MGVVMNAYERKRQRFNRIIAAIEAGFWYTKPGEDGYITYRLYYRESALPDKCTGEFSHKREVEAAMLRQHKEVVL